MNSEQHMENIVRYLEGKMTVSERMTFEKRLQKDAELREEVDRTRMSLLFADSLEQDAMENQFSNWNKELLEAEKAKPKSSGRIWPFLLLIPLAVGTYFLINSDNGNEIIEEGTEEKIAKPEIKIEEKKEAEIEKIEAPKTKSNKESKTVPNQTDPKPTRPIAALLSSEQRALLSSEILIIDGIRSNKTERALLHPMWALLEDGRKLLLENKSSEALLLLKKIPENDVYFPKALELIGHAELALQNCPTAIRAFQKSLSRVPNTPQNEYALYLAYKQCALENDASFLFLKNKIGKDAKHPFQDKVK